MRIALCLICLALISTPARANCGIGRAISDFDSSSKDMDDYKKVMFVILNNENDNNQRMDYINCGESELRSAHSWLDDMQGFLIGNGQRPDSAPIQAIHQSQRRIRRRVRTLNPSDPIPEPVF